jgi:hypothetical protein
MADGSLCRMVQEGLTTAFTLLAFAGRLDNKTGLNFSRAYFDPIFASVSGSPRDLVCFLGEILGDPDPLGGRCVASPCEQYSAGDQTDGHIAFVCLRASGP